MFNIGDIVRIVNVDDEYSITINGTIGKIVSLPDNGKQRFKIKALPTERNRSHIGEDFPIYIEHMELVEEYVTIPHAHVISKIKVLQDRFDKRRKPSNKHPSDYVVTFTT